MSHSDVDLTKAPKWWTRFSIAVMIGGGAVGVIGMQLYYPLDMNWMMPLCLGVGVGVASLFTVGTYLLGRVGRHPYPLTGLINFGLLMGLVASGFGGTAIANGLLDPHPLQEIEVHVASIKARSTDEISFYVEDWREGRDGHEVAVPGNLHGLEVGDPVVVVAGPGLFGWWFHALRREDGDSP